MNHEEQNDRRLADLVAQPEEDLNLAEAALLIASAEYPTLDIARYLAHFDRMADTIDRRLNGPFSPGRVILELNRFLFDEEGFVGNIQDYFDPRNSFLNEVMERKLGIPISLSVIYLEVGQRLGLPLVGVSFPGHFLVKLSVRAGDVVLDPFLGGQSLTPEDLEQRLSSVLPSHQANRIDVPSLLGPAGKKEILLRMLRNLKAIYATARDPRRALEIVRKSLIIDPDQPYEVRDRGYLYEGLSCFRAAVLDYDRYLDMLPHADDAEAVRERRILAQRAVASLH
jgi:regulator of sirC expression with transglutaminase-like and TPR domain